MRYKFIYKCELCHTIIEKETELKLSTVAQNHEAWKHKDNPHHTITHRCFNDEYTKGVANYIGFTLVDTDINTLK